jgi:hypothetical protein
MRRIFNQEGCIKVCKALWCFGYSMSKHCLLCKELYNTYIGLCVMCVDWYLLFQMFMGLRLYIVFVACVYVHTVHCHGSTHLYLRV